jgi:hypothetical protein
MHTRQTRLDQKIAGRYEVGEGIPGFGFSKAYCREKVADGTDSSL